MRSTFPDEKATLPLETAGGGTGHFRQGARGGSFRGELLNGSELFPLHVSKAIDSNSLHPDFPDLWAEFPTLIWMVYY